MKLLRGCLNQNSPQGYCIPSLHRPLKAEYSKEEESNLADLSSLTYTKEVFTGSKSKPVNLFDRALVNEKQSGNKNIININIFGCLSQNAISTGVA